MEPGQGFESSANLLVCREDRRARFAPTARHSIKQRFEKRDGASAERNGLTIAQHLPTFSVKDI
jgi:hypothetical protein